MKHFFVKLIPPRPDFAMTMTVEEKEIMQEHSVFWKDLLDKGMCIIYGTVFEPDITYGIGIFSVKDDTIVQEIVNNDPSVKKGLNRFEIFSMKAVTK